MSVDQIKYNNSSTANYTDASIITLENCYDTNLFGYFKNGTTFNIAATYSTSTLVSKIRLRKICGIK